MVNLLAPQWSTTKSYGANRVGHQDTVAMHSYCVKTGLKQDPSLVWVVRDLNAHPHVEGERQHVNSKHEDNTKAGLGAA